jgi:hypothetical protein
MKIAKCKMQIDWKELYHFEIFILIYAICNEVDPIFKRVKAIRPENRFDC